MAQEFCAHDLAVIRTGDRVVHSDPRVASMPGPDVPTGMWWGRGNEQLIVYLDHAGVQSRSSRTTEPDRDLTFDSAVHLETPRLRSRLRLIGYVRDEIDAGDLDLPAAVRSGPPSSVQATGTQTRTLLKIIKRGWIIKRGCLNASIKVCGPHKKRVTVTASTYGVAGRFQLTKGIDGGRPTSVGATLRKAGCRGGPLARSGRLDQPRR